MAIKFLPALICIVWLGACTNDPSQDATSGTNASPNAEVVATPDSAAKPASNIATRAPFKNIMDIMMQDMHSLTLTNDPDQDFALMMKRHHQAAIEMANLEITKGERESFKALARKIMEDARKDINELNTFLSGYKPAKNTGFSKKAMEAMMKSTSNAKWEDSSAIDWQFFQLMSLHHRQGIEMAKVYLTYASQEPTKKVAQRVLKTNEADISKLNDAVLNANEKAESRP